MYMYRLIVRHITLYIHVSPCKHLVHMSHTCIRVHVHARTYTHAHTHTHVHNLHIMHAHTHTHMCAVHMHTHACTHAHTHTLRKHAHTTHTCTFMHIHTRSFHAYHIHTCILTHTHTPTRTRTHRSEFGETVAKEYLKFFEFEGMALDEAVRHFLSFFSLTGESQQRERVMAHFSDRFLHCNPDHKVYTSIGTTS